MYNFLKITFKKILLLTDTFFGGELSAQVLAAFQAICRCSGG